LGPGVVAREFLVICMGSSFVVTRAALPQREAPL
jgi:hypothetical protein